MPFDIATYSEPFWAKSACFVRGLVIGLTQIVEK